MGEAKEQEERKTVSVEVPLTRGQVAIIDAEDAEIVLPYKWCATSDGSYAVSNFGNGCLVYLHRFLLSAPPGFEVDHVDGNGLNNRRSNLRLATRGQNRQNSRIRSNKSRDIKECLGIVDEACGVRISDLMDEQSF